MLKIKSIPFCVMGMVPVLLLSACASDTGVAVEPKNGLPAGSVVMLDPRSDDSMLPALGEQMSDGAVTIYRLDGPQAPIPAQSSNQVFSPMQGVAPGTPMPVQRVQLNPPAGVNPSAAPDPRVTVFGVDGNPVNTTMMQAPMSGSVTYIQPGGMPPVISAAPLTPSMMPAPRIAPPPPPTTLNSPFAADGTIAMTPDVSSRAVVASPISPDRLATPTKRPPRGMTY